MAPPGVSAERDVARAFEGRPLRLGSIVSVGVNGTCGKLLADNGAVVRIAYLRDGGKLEERRHSRAEIEPALLPAQTRVWVQRDDRTWQDGRIRCAHRLPNGGFEYEVSFPRRGTVDVDETDLYVRAQDRLLDPARILAAQNFDPLRFYRARAAFLDRLAEMRLSCEGLSGYISAGIEIVRHQLAAVRRVLKDPVQRYLLADEVGLGKTIEAGAIIRQCMIDDPMRNVLVGVPTLMVPQWRRELRDRFDLATDRDGVTILPYDDLPGEVDEPYDLFVVDEAHHVTGLQASPIAEAVTELGRRTPRLLLLSATPALADPASFLGLLHLLDPEAHPLDLEAFQAKLNRTEALGSALRKLRGNASTFLLKSAANDLASLLADDAEVSSLTGRLLVVIDDNERQRRADTVGALRQYVAENYRVHQRLVRSRRREAQGWEFQDRGPKIEEGRVSLEHVRTEVDPDPRVENLVTELEEWREAACAALGEYRDTPVFRLAVARWDTFVTALGEDIQTFAGALKKLKPCFEGESAHLDSLRRALRGSYPNVPPRAELALMSAERLRKAISRPGGCKIVLYAGTDTRAASLYADARRRFGPDSAVDLQATPDISRLQSDRLRWADAWLIVAGPNHEEGFNFQFADAILHADLPWSVGRIEQRIGRIDRFGRRIGQIRQRVLLPSDLDGTPWIAWYHLLAQGFGIFNESVSDVQFLLADLEREIRIASFTGGGVELETMIPMVRRRLLEARARLDDQYAIDSVVMEEEPVEALQEEIDALDERQQEFEQAAKVLTEEVLQFQQVCLTENGIDPFKLRWMNRVQISNEWKEIFMPSLDRALTWRRETAIRQPNTVLLRPGAGLLDALCRFLEEDDRGRVFGLWRTAPSFKGEPRLAFVLRWRIVAEVDPGWIRDDAIDLAALDRRLATLAPPWNRTQYLDADMNPVADPDLLAVLTGPDAADICLARRRDLLEALVDEGTLARSCRRAWTGGEEALRADEEFGRAWGERVQRVRLDIADRRRRLTAREAVLARSGAVDRTIAWELQGDALLERAVNDPLIVLDAMGVVVIAGATPGGLGRGGMP